MTGRRAQVERRTSAQIERWDQVLNGLAEILGPGPRLVVVDGHQLAALFADRLAHALSSLGYECARLSDLTPHHDEDGWRSANGPRAVALADGRRWRSRPPGSRWDVVIWLRTSGPAPSGREAEHGAHIVIDLHDPGWPVVRHIDPALAARDRWYITETRAFFAARASTWDTKFGDDLPAYARAVEEIGPIAGAVVLDVGCGTGRALPALRAAVGAGGVVIGVDITTEMLATARGQGRADDAYLLHGDARRLPTGDSSVDVVFAAGLLTHLPDVEPGLAELARVTVDGGRLALFHPSGRVAVAARHGRSLRDGDPLNETPLREAMSRTGWRLDVYDDPEHRFFVLATRLFGATRRGGSGRVTTTIARRASAAEGEQR